MRVGLTFNLKRVDSAKNDQEAEYDSPKTIAAIEAAIASHGHRVVRLEATRALPVRLSRAKVDLVFNLAEGQAGRNREAHVPALCEMLGIPFTGSDCAALSLTLDKALCKRVLRDARVPTPDFFLLETGREPLPPGWKFPAILKPNTEGTSKGITTKSVVDDPRALRRLARELIARYRQPVIAERYVTGREFTVGILGDPAPRALPPMEVVFLQGGKRPVYEYSLKQDWAGKLEYECPAKLPRAVSRAMQAAALHAFRALGCRDVARIDFRLGARGIPWVLEVNPLPGLTPKFSDIVMSAEGAGLTYEELIGEILACGIRRMGRA